MDLAVGIQTNGLFPGTLEALLSERLADKIAIDYKTRWEGYSGMADGRSTDSRRQLPDIRPQIYCDLQKSTQGRCPP